VNLYLKFHGDTLEVSVYPQSESDKRLLEVFTDNDVVEHRTENNFLTDPLAGPVKTELKAVHFTLKKKQEKP